MTTRNDLTDLPALEELGRRLDTGIARNRRPARRSRRALSLAAAGLVLVAAPAAAAIVVLGPPATRLEEVLPRAAEAIDRDDPVATGRELRRLGFDVRWVLITDNPGRRRPGELPTLARDVSSPPPGTEILAVLQGDGDSAFTPETRALHIEIAPVGSEILRSHDDPPGG